MTYNYSVLEKILSENTKKIMKETADEKDIKLCRATANALDFMDIARDLKLKLRLANGHEEDLPKAMMAAYTLNRKNNKSISQSKKDIALKMGSYLLFAMANDLSSLKDQFTIEINHSTPIPVLSHTDSEGKVITFDVYASLEKTLKEFQYGGADSNYLMFGTLSPFYLDFTENFLKKI